MDLFRPSRIASLGGKHYVFMIVDDFSRFTWVLFLTYKDNVLKVFTTFFLKKMQNKKDYTIASIRSDHGGGFVNDVLESFCMKWFWT